MASNQVKKIEYNISLPKTAAGANQDFSLLKMKGQG
jgi:hypothetical protein